MPTTPDGQFQDEDALDVFVGLQRRAPWSVRGEKISIETLVDYLRAIDLGLRWAWVQARGWTPSHPGVDRMSQILRQAGLIAWQPRPREFRTTPLGREVLQVLVTGFASHSGGSDGG